MIKKYGLIIFIISLIIFFLGFHFYFNNVTIKDHVLDKEYPTHYNGKQFAGSQSCFTCHQDIYEAHIETPHFKSSKLASKKDLEGIIKSHNNSFQLAGGKIKLEMEDDGYYQLTINEFGEITDRTKIDIIIGSNTKGQSYLNFEGDSLYQMQASYFNTEKVVTNSPGYPNYPFKREVKDNCIKCHVTFAKNKDLKGNSNVYNKESFMYGIDCESCHGPSKEHVDYRLGTTQQFTTDPIVKIKDLDRQSKIDVCAQCHAGLRSNQIKGNPFSYVVGDTLENYTKNYYSGKPESELDVHGNQYGLLKSSACYNKSPSMSCTTCHDPHKNQRGNSGYFNSKCIGCHAEPKKLHPMLGGEKFNDCISCHMPVSKSKNMKINVKSVDKSVEVRTHLIGVYQ
jgi:hypothetical protein